METLNKVKHLPVFQYFMKLLYIYIKVNNPTMDMTTHTAPLAATRNANIDADQDTYKSQLIREWVLAVEDNMKNQDINAGVTLFCIRCKNFDPSAVCDCAYNGCAMWPFRTAGLKLD